MPTIDGDAGDNFLTGTGGADTLNGVGGQDRLNGNPGADILNGGDGNDTLYDGTLWFNVSTNTISSHDSDQQGDTLNGGNGDDTIYGNIGDSIIGGAGFDRLTLSLSSFNTAVTMDMRIVEAGGTINLPGVSPSGGGYIVVPNGAQLSGIEQIVSLQLTMAADTFYGTSSNDTVDGYEGNDTIYGMGGDDVLNGWTGTNTLDGGDGNDTLSSSFGPGIQLMSGGAGDDVATLLGSGSTFDGGDGFDRVSISSGSVIDLSALDTGGAGTINGASAVRNVEQVSISLFGGDLTFTGSNLSETVTTFTGQLIAHGGGGNDALTGAFSGATNDALYGEAGNDTLSGYAGNDWLDGGVGDDTLSGGAGSNLLEGGDGLDLASYSAASTALWVDMATGGYTASGVWDVYLSIEGAIGGTGNDALMGDAQGNRLLGGDGADTLLGRDGGDTLLGQAGNDWLDGGAGDDALEGGDGVNILIGGDGVDLASYASATTGLWVNLAAGVYAGTGVWDVFFESIEGARGGSGNDSLFGNAGDNRLEGMNGDDVLVGDAGNDTLVGSAGSDWIVGGDGGDRLVGGDGVDLLTGGAGADVFDLGAAAGWDVAFDFSTAEDRFNLGGNLWLGLVEGDWDGDGQADDTMMGYAGGNFVALNVSGLTLEQWNALVIAPPPPGDGEGWSP